MLDTKGPEVRTGKLKNKTARLEAGKEIKVCVDTSLQGDENMIAIDYKELATSVKVGGKILIADGTISLTGKYNAFFYLYSSLFLSISIPCSIRNNDYTHSTMGYHKSATTHFTF